MDVVSAWVKYCGKFGKNWSPNDAKLSREAFFAGAEAAQDEWKDDICPECLGSNGKHSDDCKLRPVVEHLMG